MAELCLTVVSALSGEPLARLQLPPSASCAELRLRASAALAAPVKILYEGEPISGSLEDAGLRSGAEIQVIVLRGQKLLAGSLDGGACIWDVEERGKVSDFHHGADMNIAAASLNGEFLATAGLDAKVMLWQQETLDLAMSLEGHRGQIYDLSFCPQGRALLSASGDSTACLWDLETQMALRSFKGHTRDVNAVAFSAEGQVFATGSDDYCFALWDRRGGHAVKTWDGRRGEGHAGRVYSVALAGGEPLLATGAVDKRAKLWDLRTGQCLKTRQHQDLVNCVRCAADGRWVSASDDGTAQLGREEVVSYAHASAVLSASFADDGQLATGCCDGSIWLWSSDVGEQLSAAPSSSIKSVCFIPT